jgi:hypothetical protein
MGKKGSWKYFIESFSAQNSPQLFEDSNHAINFSNIFSPKKEQQLHVINFPSKYCADVPENISQL